MRTFLTLLLLPIFLSGCGNDTATGEKHINQTAAGHDRKTGTEPAATRYAYVGKEICSGCHPRETELYTNSHHDLAMQHAGKETILGDFNNTGFTYNKITSTFFRRNGKYFVSTDGPDGKLEDFEIKYTFGVFPLQQYLIELPGGRLQAFSIAWDSRRREAGGQHWFHLYPGEKIDYRDKLHWTGINQNWNYMCAECHTTGYEKNFDSGSNSYHSGWAEIDVSCEACHGPGSRHVKLATELSHDELDKIRGKGLAVNFSAALKGKWEFPDKASIASLDASRNNNVLIDICAHCHSRRTVIDTRESFTKPLYDTHVVSLLEQGLYYLEAPQDHRAVFAMPWQGHLLLGTTETPYQGDPSSVTPLPQECEYLLEVLQHYFPRFAQQSVSPLNAFAGLRVLPQVDQNVFYRPRETILWLDDESSPVIAGIYGGKLTAYRATAEKVMRRLSAVLPARKVCADTRRLTLHPVQASKEQPVNGMSS